MGKHLFDKNPPCKTCVSLAICKSFANINDINDSYDLIAPRCSEFKSFIQLKGQGDYVKGYLTTSLLIRHILSCK